MKIDICPSLRRVKRVQQFFRSFVTFMQIQESQFQGLFFSRGYYVKELHSRRPVEYCDLLRIGQSVYHGEEHIHCVPGVIGGSICSLTIRAPIRSVSLQFRKLSF
ncbi:hypothetical protein AVEN_178918-1 [Araneus ventricosus]|uniref:Uncharacterized protein n=1 Tax=Araneus ventricosus TaxID=182803 RepID=A0A4Y2LPY6_ARAVE|nr:hypothetical protein AVEN_156105-1 [Araneus ventricosus]GBN16831.1 hypothetical protein AVEN_178918-1 [Araneus ventricosus]